MSQELSNRDVRRNFRMRKNASTRIDFEEFEFEELNLHGDFPIVALE